MKVERHSHSYESDISPGWAKSFDPLAWGSLMRCFGCAWGKWRTGAAMAKRFEIGQGLGLSLDCEQGCGKRRAQ